MTTEDKLKQLILKRYYSIRDFTTDAEIPYTTMDSIFRRGVENSNLRNIIKICKALKISVDALADGEIVPLSEHFEKPRDIMEFIEIEEILDNAKDALTHSGFITLDKKIVRKDDVDSIINAIEIGVEMVKRKL